MVKFVTFSGRQPSQKESEINSLVQFAHERGVKKYLEIGARHGDTFHYMLTRLNALGTQCSGLALDLPGAAWGQPDSVAALRRCIKDLSSRGFAASMLLRDSHDEVTIEMVRQRGPYDLVLIDGDHRFGPVMQDFRDYSPMARFVAFHDIAGVNEHTRTIQRFPVEVPRAWAELKPSFEHFEFIQKGSAMGIGVLVMPSDADDVREGSTQTSRT